MLDKIFIVDFDDSFTYNIANILFPFESNLKVIGHREFFSNILPHLLDSKHTHAVILGPGPGHPNEYENYESSIKKLLLKKNIYTMGICLGHQIMGKMNGYTVADSLEKVHGLSVQVKFKNEIVTVQRYNSLAVFSNGVEVDISHYPNGISYQFHPESIGTDQNDIFFKDLLAFVGND